MKCSRVLPLLSLAILASCKPSEAPRGAVNAASAATTSVTDSARADAIARARQDSINRAQPGYVIDSIFTPEEELRRFRTAVGGTRVTSLHGGSRTREALVRRFVKALSDSNTADLRAMVVSAREFADLYYPESPSAHPPYHQPPALAWRLMSSRSDAGIGKLLTRVGGHSLAFGSEKCEPKVLVEGETRRYTGCLVRITDALGHTSMRRYYGSIVERDGQFKFLSYANDL